MFICVCACVGFYCGAQVGNSLKVCRARRRVIGVLLLNGLKPVIRNCGL